MRILLVSEWGPCLHGGVASQVRLLAEWLRRWGHEAYVAYRRGGCGGAYAIKVRAPLSGSATLPTPRGVEELIRSLEPDVVHVHHAFAPLSILAAASCNRLGIPYVLTNHSLPPTNKERLWWSLSYVSPYRRVLKPTVATAVSGSAAKFFHMLLDGRVPLLVVPNAVDASAFKPGEERERVVLYVGRLVRRKGVHVLVRAARLLRGECRVVIAGKGYLRPYLSLLSSGLDNVELIGEVSDEEKASLYRGALALALPSLAGESFGVVIIEAFASETPVVASAVGGIPEVVEHGVNGLLVEPGSPRSLASAIRALIEDEGLWRRLSANARRSALERYSIESVGRQYLKAYELALAIWGKSGGWGPLLAER